MSLANRAAQFAPFAALTGHEAAILETARLTESFVDLTDEEKNILSRKLARAFDRQKEVKIKYFRPDLLKGGGSYEETEARIKSIDEIERKVFLYSGKILSLDLIIDIRGSGVDDFG